MRRAALALSAALLAMTVLASCSAGPRRTGGTSLPNLGSVCPDATSREVPVHLSFALGSGGPVPFVSVCVDGHGPYSFVLDSAASVSLVDSKLVDELHLGAASPSQEIVGVGCVSTAKRVNISSWSAGGLALAPQPVLTAELGGLGLPPSAVGLLGSDVLARFGAVRVDFKAKELVVLGPEAPRSLKADIVRGGIFDTPAPTLVARVPEAAVSLTVITFAGSVLPTTSVVFDGHTSPPSPFVVSTGSGRSSVAAGLATSLGLKPGGPKVRSTEAGCRQKAEQVGSGPWNVGSTVPVFPAPLVAFTPSLATENGVQGTLGTNVLSRYGSIVLDYRSGILWLGTG